MMNARLFLVQRLSAIVMIPLVFGHLGMMIYAIQGGLSAEEILSRTRGSVFWAAYYGLFVVAVSIHGAIGFRTILFEWAGVRKQGLFLVFWGVLAILLATGLRAVWAVIA